MPEVGHGLWTKELENLEEQLEGGFSCLRPLGFIPVRVLSLVVNKEKNLVEEVFDELLILKDFDYIIVLLSLVEEAEYISNGKHK